MFDLKTRRLLSLVHTLLQDKRDAATEFEEFALFNTRIMRLEECREVISDALFYGQVFVNMNRDSEIVRLHHLDKPTPKLPKTPTLKEAAVINQSKPKSTKRDSTGRRRQQRT